MSTTDDNERSSPASLSFRQSVLRVAIVSAACFLAHQLAFLYATEEVIMPIWPAGGVGLAALLLNPVRLWPVIIASLYVAGVSADMLLQGWPFFVSIGYMTGDIVEAVGCAWVITRWCGKNVRFGRAREVLALIAGVVFVNAGGACIGAAAAACYRDASFGSTWLLWYIANGLGLLLITPLIVTWAEALGSLRGVRWSRVVESIAFMALWCTAAWLSFHPRLSDHVLSPQPYLLVALLGWPALRLGQCAVATAMVVLAGIAVTSEAVSTGPLLWGGADTTDRLLSVQVFLGCGAIAGFLLAASYTETKAAERDLRVSEEKFSRIFSSASNPLAFTNAINGRIGNVNEAWIRVFGISREEAIGRTALELGLWPSLGDREACLAELREKGRLHEYETRMIVKSKELVFLVFAEFMELRGERYVLWEFRDITVRKHQEEEIKRKSEEMETFTYTVSHDLRSPLVTIVGFLSQLKKDVDKGDGEQIESDFSFIHNAAEKMENLLQELLGLSRVGRRTNPPEDVLLQELVRETLDLVAGRISESHVSVTVTEVPFILHGDRQRLREVFQNLIDNAVKFMGGQASPRIEVGAEDRDGEAVLFVKDNGIGIDPRHQHRLFGPFERLHPEISGVGMGLAIIKRIVEVHGGRIWAESAGEGQGSTFCFTLAGTRRV